MPLLNLLNMLAQSPAAQNTRSIMVWAGVMLLVSVILIIVGVILYRWFNQPIKTDESDVGFTLDDLRLLHQQGQLSDDEYGRARDKLLAKFPTVSPPAQGPDNTPRPENSDSKD
ncbi:MAG: SHOCT domain-containing protein [Phycisphaerales bacterium]|nr:SHOCT domain-containing protein [Phycisphaerales bacterium]